ncbi:unnamed protein product [Effrenium voratum]|uniref:40S ribosomal protein S12 n=1 Tax=Effrenium voratum TaxID=2562239 RepID=A0AA36IM92_9DINO|nr:unnamed protein product [Effrenium voratum]
MAELDEEEVAAPEVEKPSYESTRKVTDVNGAVRGVLKKSLMVDGVIRGLHEVAKNVEAGRAQVVFLAESCNEATYKKLIQGLCLEKNVPLIDVPDNKSLGEWAGLCKIDKDGHPRKVVGASCVAVVDFGEEGQVRDVNGAVRGVLKKSLMVDGVIRGLHEVAKNVEAGRAQVVFLAESCNEATYKKLIQGLCLEKNVPLIDVPDNKSLGEWAGLCKIDKDGHPRKAGLVL